MRPIERRIQTPLRNGLPVLAGPVIGRAATRRLACDARLAAAPRRPRGRRTRGSLPSGARAPSDRLSVPSSQSFDALDSARERRTTGPRSVPAGGAATSPNEQDWSRRRERPVSVSRPAGCAQPSATTSPSWRSRKRRPGARAGGARRAGRAALGVARAPGPCIKILKAAGRDPGRDGRAGQARQDFFGHHAGHDAAVGPDTAEGAQHRRADICGGRRHARSRHRAARFDGVSVAAAGARRAC